MPTCVLHGGPLDGTELETTAVPKTIVVGAAVHYGEGGFPFFAPVNPGEPACDPCAYVLFRRASESDLAFYLYEGRAR